MSGRPTDTGKITCSYESVENALGLGLNEGWQPHGAYL